MVCEFLYVNLHIMIHSSLQHCCHYNKNKKYASLGQMIPSLDMLMLFCVFFAFWLMDKEKNILYVQMNTTYAIIIHSRSQHVLFSLESQRLSHQLAINNVYLSFSISIYLYSSTIFSKTILALNSLNWWYPKLRGSVQIVLPNSPFSPSVDAYITKKINSTFVNFESQFEGNLDILPSP